MHKYLAIIAEIWKLKMSDSAKTLLSILVMFVGLGITFWLDK